MLSFVKINKNGGIWANRDEALVYLSKGYKVYTGTDEATELTKEDLDAIVESDERTSTSGTVEVSDKTEG